MHKKHISCLIGLTTGFCNGLFGSGGGTVAVPCMEKFLKTQAKKAHATAVAVILPLSVISGLIYFHGIPIPLKETISAGIGGFFGGLLGSKLLGKIQVRYLHMIFGAVMLISGARMIF